MRCSFCDSVYAIKPDNKTYKLDILEKLDKNPNIQHIVFTGGEPMLNRNMPQIVRKLINQYQVNVTIETNGTIFYEGFYGLNNPENLLFSISPKLSNSIPKDETLKKIHTGIQKYTPESCYNYMKYHSENVIFKFVIKDKDDIEEMREFIDEVNEICYDNNEMAIYPDIIYLMPMAATKKQLHNRRQFVINQCKKYGYNYSPRLQIDIWGTKRGV